MKFFAILLFAGASQAFLVRREAEADPEAEPGYGYGAVSPPVCKSVPVTTCNPRQVETPRQECHQEYDEIVDTTITEHCEEVITTTCHQTSTHTKHSSAVVGHDSKVVASGVAAGPVAVAGPVAGPVVAGYGAHVGYGKREAEPEADPEADPGYGYGAVGPVAASAPVCESVPVKKCNKVPVSTPRKVAKTVCKTVTDITTIEDCQETVTTECTQTSTKVASHSKVVGTDTKVGPASVVATHHAAPAAGPVVARYGGYGLAGYGGW